MSRNQITQRSSRPSVLLAAAIIALGGAPALAGGGAPGPFLRGDANGTGHVDIADAVATLAYLFSAGPDPVCMDAADANDDGAVNLADPVGTLAYLFSGGATPIPGPFPAAGYDWTADSFACAPVPCQMPSQFGQAITPGATPVTTPIPPQSWSPSILGIGLVDVELDLSNSFTAVFGPIQYSAESGTASMAPSTFPLTGALDIDGPLTLDWSCTITVTIEASAGIDFAQQQVSPELILIQGIDDLDLVLSVDGVSLASCGLSATVFNVVYPLISGYANTIVDTVVLNALSDVFEASLADAVNDQWDPVTNSIPICVP